MCLKWIRITYVQHRDVISHFESFYLNNLNFKQNLVWKGTWAAIVWSICEHRNNIVFKQGQVDSEEILRMAQLKTWL